jgi:hypothetical protein
MDGSGGQLHSQNFHNLGIVQMEFGESALLFMMLIDHKHSFVHGVKAIGMGYGGLDA